MPTGLLIIIKYNNTYQPYKPVDLNILCFQRFQGLFLRQNLRIQLEKWKGIAIVHNMTVRTPAYPKLTECLWYNITYK